MAKLRNTVRVAKSAKFPKKILELESMDSELSKTGLRMSIRLLDRILGSDMYPYDSSKFASKRRFLRFFVNHVGTHWTIKIDLNTE